MGLEPTRLSLEDSAAFLRRRHKLSAQAENTPVTHYLPTVPVTLRVPLIGLPEPKSTLIVQQRRLKSGSRLDTYRYSATSSPTCLASSSTPLRAYEASVTN